MTQRTQVSNGMPTAATSARRGTVEPAASKYDANPSGIVVGLTVSLSWQLAVTVLVPILGGHFLDDHFQTTPWLTLAGFAVAMAGMVLVLRATLKQLNEYMKKPADSSPEGGRK